MKPKIKKLWVAALRSGDYKKTTGTLRDDHGFCCLGVLCNLHAQAHPRIAKKQTDPDVYLGESALLPEEVREWAGLKHDDGDEVIVRGRNHTLPDLNDNGTSGKPWSFKEIADVIERQL